MLISKSIIENSIDVITKNAKNCSDLAKVERANADELHETARKLEKLGNTLQVDALDLKSELKALPK
jgi:hypothetical protein